MKTILMAAAAVIAVPAFAQMQTTPTTTPTPDQAQTIQNDQTMPAQSSEMPQTPQAGNSAMPMAGQNGQAMSTAGGYSPQMAPNSGPPMPGQTVTYQQAPSPNEAFPPPAAQTGPLPYCKVGQYDNCRERENARGQGVRQHRTRR